MRKRPIQRVAQCLLMCVAALGAIALSAPASSQTTGESRASVGQGAPRSTLVYVTTNPAKLRSMAGYENGAYRWLPDAESGEMPEEARQLVDYLNGMVDNSTRMDFAMIDARIDPETGPMPAMYMDFTLKLGYFPEVQPEFLNEPVSEGMLEIEEIQIAGLAATRYRFMERDYSSAPWDGGGEPKEAREEDWPEDEGMPEEEGMDGDGVSDIQVQEGEMDEPEEPDYEMRPVVDIFTIQHNNHYYVCTFYSVVERLARGLGGSDLDGESLADFRRFAQWHEQERTNAAVEVWVNAYEVRRWVERVQPGELQDINELVSPQLDLRNWSQIVMTLDWEESTRESLLSLRVDSRKPIPALAKLNFPTGPQPLACYIPEGSLGVFGMHIGEPTSLFERLREDIREIVNTQAEREAARQREWEEERKWDERKWDEEGPSEGEGEYDDKDGHQDGEMEGEAGDEAEQDAFDQQLEELNNNLGEFGTDVDSLLHMFNGQVVGFLDRATEQDSGVEPGDEQPIVVVLGLKDRAALVEVLNQVAEKFNQDEDEWNDVETFEMRGLPGYRFDDEAHYLVGEQAMLLVFTRDAERAREVLGRMLESSMNGIAPEAQPLMQALTGILHVNLGAIAQAELQIEERRSRMLHPDAAPVSGDMASLIPSNASFSLSLTHSVDSFTIAAKTRQLDLGVLFEAGLKSQGYDSRDWYAESQLDNVYQAVMEYQTDKGSSPFTLDDLKSAGLIRTAHLQSPFDPRFKNADKLNWFVGNELDEEWYEGDEGVEAARAAEAEGFVSYTYVGPKAADEGGFRILMFETEANRNGGRTVLYANGQVGWLHDSVWAAAKQHIEAGTPIITEEEYYGYDDREHGKWDEPKEADPAEGDPMEGDE